VTAHGLLLAGILFLLPEGMRDAGPSVAGVEVELLPFEFSRNGVEQAPQVEPDAPEMTQAHVQPVFESLRDTLPETLSETLSERPVVQRLEKQANTLVEKTEAAADSGFSRKVEKAGIAEPQTLASSQPAVQGTAIQEQAEVRSESAATIEAEKARNVVVRQRLESFKHYPSSARRRGIEGAVDVSFRLNAQGRAENMQLMSGSGYGILDDAAMNTVRRAEPFPVTQGSYRFRLRFTRS